MRTLAACLMPAVMEVAGRAAEATATLAVPWAGCCRAEGMHSLPRGTTESWRGSHAGGTARDETRREWVWLGQPPCCLPSPAKRFILWHQQAFLSGLLPSTASLCFPGLMLPSLSAV